MLLAVGARSLVNESTRIRIGDWTVVPALNLVERNGESIKLEPRAMDLLVYLATARERVVSADELLREVWQGRVFDDGIVYKKINQLRKAFGDDPQGPRVIETIPKRGYRLIAAVVLSEAEDPGPSVGHDRIATLQGHTETASPLVVERKGRRLAAMTAVAATAAAAMVGAAVWYFARSEQRSAALPTSVAVLPTRDDSAVRAVLPNSVAVLPLANLSSGPEQAAYADGMHAEIIHQLSKLRNLNVIARDAVLQNVGNRSLAERARDLGVQSILTGTFQYVDGRIRVNMQLVDPASSRNVWTQDYEEPFEDVFAVQADIATRVAAALGAELTLAERQRMATRPTTSGEAYAIYLLALNHQNSGRRIEALSQFERAVAIDPAFSLAYGKLAILYARAVIDEVSGPAASIAPSELERRVSDNARAALNLDPDSATAYAALGNMNALFWRWGEAEAAFASALALNPNDLDALYYCAIFQSSRGQYREALSMAKRILELNPTVPNTEGDSRFTTFGSRTCIPATSTRH